MIQYSINLRILPGDSSNRVLFDPDVSVMLWAPIHDMFNRTFPITGSSRCHRNPFSTSPKGSMYYYGICLGLTVLLYLCPRLGLCMYYMSYGQCPG